MSDQKTKKQVPLTVGLHKVLPNIAHLLGDIFEFDANLLGRAAEGVRTYDNLLRWLQVPNNNAERNFGLNLRVSKKLSKNEGLSGFVLYVRKGETQIMTFEFNRGNVIFNVRGLYLDWADETATRADIEAFQLHLKDVGCEKYFQSALKALGPPPKGGRALEAYTRALAALDEALSERVVYRRQLNSEVVKFKDFLDRILGDYKVASPKVEVLYRGGITPQGKEFNDPKAFRYNGDDFTLEVGGDYAVLKFAFATISLGGGEQKFCAAKFVHAMRKQKLPAAYTLGVMKALLAFEIFSQDCALAEANRRRILRVMCCQPKSAALPAA